MMGITLSSFLLQVVAKNINEVTEIFYLNIRIAGDGASQKYKISFAGFVPNGFVENAWAELKKAFESATPKFR